MKKIIIALLAVILLVTTVIMCWPMDTKAEASSPWAADGSDTPGHANYDHVTKAEFASSLGIAEGSVNVITNYTELQITPNFAQFRAEKKETSSTTLLTFLMMTTVCLTSAGQALT